MTTRRISEETEREIALARRLSKVQQVARLDEGEHNEGWALAHGLTDIEQSCRVLLDKLMPALRSERITDEQINDILLDIGEELRQVLYHLQHLKYYGYLGATEEDA